MPSIRSACPQCETTLQDASTLFCPKCSFPLMLIAGKYRLERALEKGGFGTVYLAHHTGLTRDTERVIKVIEPGMFAEEESQIRFRREVELTSSLSQRNNHIVRIYDDFGREPELGYYYVMEFLRGKPLSHVMCPGKPLHPKLVFLMMEQLCSALDAAHREHIVHRDLKPPNIFLIERDKNPCFVKILDFGIAKPITEQSKALTRHILGTPHYMSPEQCLNEPVDARSDLYALGMLFYHMSTGTHPYKSLKAGSDFAVMQAQISQPPIPMCEKRPELAISEELDQVVLKAIAKEADDRFPTAGAFWAALRPFAPSPSSPSELQGLMSAAIAVRAADIRRRQAPSRPPTMPLSAEDALSAAEEPNEVSAPPASEDAFSSLVPPSSPASFEMLDAVDEDAPNSSPQASSPSAGVSSSANASNVEIDTSPAKDSSSSKPLEGKSGGHVISSPAGSLMVMEPANSIRETTQDVPLELFGLLQPSDDDEEERERVAKLREAMRSMSVDRVDGQVPVKKSVHPSSPSLDSLRATVPVSVLEEVFQQSEA
ncbi:MAG: serine/threonine protein kinase, partial [Myxococcales bacterium]|nr:serine/threonine protein kinase [Myxococcales bacterium]